MKIGVVIPIHNEALAIGRVVKSVVEKGLDVIVIDDGSTDHSSEIAKAAGAIVSRYDLRQGKGYALLKGYEYIKEHKYDGAIVMDGDGQHDVCDIQKFIDLAQKEHVCVITGNRMSDAKGMPFIRLLTNRFMSALISWGCKQSIPDTQCGYRYISTRILKEIQLQCYQFETETELLMKASKKGFKIFSVPIKTIYGDERSHIRPIKDTIRFFTYFLRELKSK